MNLTRSIVVAVGAAAGVCQPVGEARAGMLFGPQETIRPLAPTGDPQFVLGHKVYTYFFVMGCYVRDDGYVLQQVGQQDRYAALGAERIRQLQAAGTLPTPLPAYSLTFTDYLLGYLNWIWLAGMGAVYAIRRAVRRPRPRPPPPEVRRPVPYDPAEADPNEKYTRKCPACGSTRVRVLIPAGEDDSLFEWGNFRVFRDRGCGDCGRRWTPACPRWAAYGSVAAGAVLTGGTGLILLWCARGSGVVGLLAGVLVGLLPGTGGAFALVYGIGTLRGDLGQLRMR